MNKRLPALDRRPGVSQNNTGHKHSNNDENKSVTPPYEQVMLTPEEAKKNTLIGVGFVAVIILVIGIIVGVICISKHNAEVASKNAQDESSQVLNNKDTLRPAEYITDDGAIQWTQDGIVKGKLPAKWDKTPKVDVYLDPICPGCGSIDRLLNPYYREDLNAGKIVLRIHPITFLTNYSTDDYSGRAANAIIRSLDADPSKTLDFITYLMSEGVEPEEGPNYEPVSDEEIRDHAIHVGYTKENTKDLMDQKYNTWLRASTQYIINRSDLKRSDGTFATPIVTVNGTKLALDGTNTQIVNQYNDLVNKDQPSHTAKKETGNKSAIK